MLDKASRKTLDLRQLFSVGLMIYTFFQITRLGELLLCLILLKDLIPENPHIYMEMQGKMIGTFEHISPGFYSHYRLFECGY